MIKENKTYSIKTSWVQDSKGSIIDRKEFSDYTQEEIETAGEIAERITYNFFQLRILQEMLYLLRKQVKVPMNTLPQQ